MAGREMENVMNKIRIGTRGSRLALKQAALVQEALQAADDSLQTEIVILRTKGDIIQDKPLAEIGDKGVFASEFEQALQEGRIDLAVHSAKDLPMTLAGGLTIAAVLPRADARDVLVVPKQGRMPLLAGESEEAFCGSGRQTDRRQETGNAGEDKERNDYQWMRRMQQEQDDGGTAFRIGSGSRRRQLLAGKLWKNVVCENIRGNVDTRLRKLQEGGYDGIILAKAGLDRLGISCKGSDGSDGGDDESAFLFCPLPPELFLPAACQGMIAVEAAQGSEAEGICRRITDAETMLCFQAEREVLRQLSADCSEAAAAWCRQEQDRLILDAMYAGHHVRYIGSVSLQEGRRLAAQAAGELREKSQIHAASEWRKRDLE